MRTLRSKLLHFGQTLLETAHPSLLLFFPISWIWGFIVLGKHWLYDRGWLSPKKAPKLVVSIGNIVAGGTGKTPLAILLANLFSERKVALLSRGSSMQGDLADEPALLAQRCPLANIYLGRDRRKTAAQASQDACELLILDDGFQHRKLFRDFDLVLVSAARPFSNGRYLPCGFLRDSPKRLKWADLIFVNPIHSEEELAAWQRTFPFSTPLIGVRLALRRLIPACSLDQIPVALFCGIAHPSAFRETVQTLGAPILAEWTLADHEAPSPVALQQFAYQARSQGAKFLLCTEKDHVKLPSFLPLALPLVYLEMELHITAGQRHWQNLVDKIGGKIDNYRTYGT